MIAARKIREEFGDREDDELPGKARGEMRKRLSSLCFDERAMKFKAQIVSRIRRQASEIAKTDHAGASRCCVNTGEINYAVCVATGPDGRAGSHLLSLRKAPSQRGVTRYSRSEFLSGC